MIRTQIQLTEEQMESLKKMAGSRRVSTAELVREAVDRLSSEGNQGNDAQRIARAKSAAGRFASGSSDGSARHDDHFASTVLP